MIKPFIDDEGKQDFKLIYADQNTWKKPFEQAISAKMNQLKSCDKYLQFVMDDNNVDLKYDESTFAIPSLDKIVFNPFISPFFIASILSKYVALLKAPV